MSPPEGGVAFVGHSATKADHPLPGRVTAPGSLIGGSARTGNGNADGTRVAVAALALASGTAWWILPTAPHKSITSLPAPRRAFVKCSFYPRYCGKTIILSRRRPRR